ncbi:MAG TPA: glycoside hydrolase family 2 protein [Chloroflexota bacterium]|nr:glycoside hydrolase family 2 protein [Chloroflexota bacterium]
MGTLTSSREIAGGWTVRPEGEAPWNPALALPVLPATVPGHVHLDLQRAGVIPDPFYRLHERDVAWVDDLDWTYETAFEWHREPGRWLLRFNGLDTVAAVSLNDEQLLDVDNMFVPHEVDVTDQLRDGENQLRITFRSALRTGLERQAAWMEEYPSPPPEASIWHARSFVRKAQYMFGWDWGPVLISCGIWQPIELIHVPFARITDWSVTADIDSSRIGARIAVTVEPVDVPDLRIVVGLGDHRSEVPVRAGQVEADLDVSGARLWHPDDPFLHPLRLELIGPGGTLDSVGAQVGLRRVELIQEPDEWGTSFTFRINGRDHFVRGANWIPAHSFPSTVSEATLRPVLQAARDAGLTMLRVWGGGLYESEDFYRLCDEMGILVWQDFPYACAYYPDDAATRVQAYDEAVRAVRRIRHHPSIALWCGNNENHQVWHDRWEGLEPDHFLGEALYHEVLPAAVAAEDPTTPYWPGSPWGGSDPNSPAEGDRHNWSVWHAQAGSDGDWPAYREDTARFCSEFGFASSCGWDAWDTCLAPEDRNADSAAVRWHDKTLKPYDVYLNYIQRHFPDVHSLDDLIYYSQLNQAEAIRCAVEHYRRLRGRNWGTLIWQLNDCWPVQSWSLIDAAGDRKAAYYAAKRFYRPQLLSVAPEAEGLAVHFTNDTADDVAGTLDIQTRTFTGDLVDRREIAVRVSGESTARLAGVPDMSGPNRFLVAQLRDTRAIHLYGEPCDLAAPQERSLSIEVEPQAVGSVIRVRAAAFTPYLYLTARGLGSPAWSDNAFHLLPGEEKSVQVSGIEPADLRSALRVRTLWDADVPYRSMGASTRLPHSVQEPS